MAKKRSSKVTARSGRFASRPAAEANAFTNSVKFDTRLAHHDIAGSIAHARMLHHVGLLKKKECPAIVTGLDAIGAAAFDTGGGAAFSLKDHLRQQEAAEARQRKARAAGAAAVAAAVGIFYVECELA